MGQGARDTLSWSWPGGLGGGRVGRGYPVLVLARVMGQGEAKLGYPVLGGVG